MWGLEKGGGEGERKRRFKNRVSWVWKGGGLEKGGSGTKRKGERGSGAGNELNFAGGMVGGSRLSRGDKRSKRDINSRGV